MVRLIRLTRSYNGSHCVRYLGASIYLPLEPMQSPATGSIGLPNRALNRRAGVHLSRSERLGKVMFMGRPKRAVARRKVKIGARSEAREGYGTRKGFLNIQAQANHAPLGGPLLAETEEAPDNAGENSRHAPASDTNFLSSGSANQQSMVVHLPPASSPHPTSRSTHWCASLGRKRGAESIISAHFASTTGSDCLKQLWSRWRGSS